MRADVMVLGGLNEGALAGLADPGPWLNRPMRGALGMQQPERRIGLPPHDFAQALGAPRSLPHPVAPQLATRRCVPSRWLKRLQALLAEAARLECQLKPGSALGPAGRRVARPGAAADPVRPPRPLPAARSCGRSS